MLKKLEDIGQLDNTIVVFTTDNGAEAVTFPDGGVTPFKGREGEAWEGGYRAPIKSSAGQGTLSRARDESAVRRARLGAPRSSTSPAVRRLDRTSNSSSSRPYPNIVKTTLDGFDQRADLEGFPGKSGT